MRNESQTDQVIQQRIDAAILKIRRVKFQLLTRLEAKGVLAAAPPARRMFAEPFDEAIRGFQAMRRELSPAPKEKR